VVPQNFLACDRDQELLLAPSLRDWLAEDHLAWCVLDAVEQIDLSGIYAAYRADGWGRAAFEPQMMVALLLYAYAVGERSSRMIERRCAEDVAFRVISANQAPDHATIARFRVRHEQALAGLFTNVLELCAKAGLVSVGLVALDGTKIEANASLAQTRTYESINAEMTQILSEAGDADAQENEEFAVGSRGDELPGELADPQSRRARLARCKAELEAEHAEREQTFREHMRDRERWEQKTGKKMTGRKPQPPERDELTQARLNVTDPDSRVMKDKMLLVQGYNAQVIASPEQVILAAALTQEPNDSGQLPPMVAQPRERSSAPGSASRSGPSSQTAATGASVPSGVSKAKASRCSCRHSARPTPPNAKPPSHTARPRNGCTPCSKSPPPSVPTAGESRSSSRSSPTPRRSDEQTASCAAAYRPARPNGSSSPPPTTS
jgi:transposase